MYIIKKEKISGTVRIKRPEVEKETTKIKRKELFEILQKEEEKEKDAIRKYDYEVLQNGIMGIEALILEKEKIHVVYFQEDMWRNEGEATIEKNNRLFQLLKRIYNNPPIQRKKKDTLQ